MNEGLHKGLCIQGTEEYTDNCQLSYSQIQINREYKADSPGWVHLRNKINQCRWQIWAIL